MKFNNQLNGWLPFALAAALLGNSTTHAATLTVTNLADNGPGTLRNEMAAAAPGDTITFSTNGTIKLTSGELYFDRSLTIAGPGPANLAIDAGGTNRVLEIAVSGVTLDSLTLTNGNASGASSPDFLGGGILVDREAALTITNCTLTGNSAALEGGGIAIESGSTLTINDSTISSNTTSDYGGGVFNNSGTLTINDSTFSLNSVTNYGDYGGGGIFNEGTLQLNGCTISSNSAPNGKGGGILNDVLMLTITNCTLSGNSAVLGGGIGNENGGTSTVNNSTLSSNTVFAPSGAGGGIFNAPNSTFTVNSCILSGNSAHGDTHDAIGGGIFNSGTMVVNNSSFSGNSSDGAGGAIGNEQAILTVNDSTLSGNSANTDDGGGIYDYGYINGATNTLNNCTLSSNSASKYGGGIANDVNSVLTVNNSTLSSNTAAFGGGIVNANTLTVNNSTLAGNSATTNGIGGGGGIWNQGLGTLNNCTLSGNSAPNGYGGGMNNDAGPLFSTNTIVAGNNALTYPDIYNNYNSASASISGSDNLTNGMPLLAPLGNYGGPTQTMPPLSGSPAIDAGTDSVTNFLATDQRGFPRLSGAHVDIGAVEVQFVAVPANNRPLLRNVLWSSAGGTNSFRFTFTNVPGADFTALASTNLSLPLANWTVLGNIPEILSGQYQFIDSGSTNSPQRFYQVVSP